MHYACDKKWWDEYGAEQKTCGAERWTVDVAAAAAHRLEWMEGIDGQGLCTRAGRLHTGGNSGYQALGLAYQFGAVRVVLLGFDMQATAGRMHWHADHPAALGNEGPYGTWAARFRHLAVDLAREGVKVVNASRVTALDCFDRSSLEVALSTPATRLMPLVIQGMHGMGDNLHQRGIVRQAMESNEVWLETPWPCLYHDLAGDRLHLVTRGTRLRTQAKNAAREAGRFSQKRPPQGSRVLNVSYPPAMVRKHGSVLGAMAAQCGMRPDDFSLPIPPEWDARAEQLMAGWKATKPILLYRPLVERSEWSGCKSRNPDAGAYRALFDAIRARFFVVSVADLELGKEWLAEASVGADIEFHGGELDIEVLAAVARRAALVYTAPGFAVILAQAVGTPSICVFGGYENSSSFSAGRTPYLGIDPIQPCDCFSHTHACVKRIDTALAEQRILEFVNAHCPQPTVDLADHSTL